MIKCKECTVRQVNNNILVKVKDNYKLFNLLSNNDIYELIDNCYYIRNIDKIIFEHYSLIKVVITIPNCNVIVYDNQLANKINIDKVKLLCENNLNLDGYNEWLDLYC